MASGFDADLYVQQLRDRLLVGSALELTLRPSPTPGGSDENTAHVHALPILDDFLIEYDPERDEDELRLGLMHELLHIAFRHIVALVTTIRPTHPLLANVLNQALEEDTEALARALLREFEGDKDLVLDVSELAAR